MDELKLAASEEHYHVHNPGNYQLNYIKPTPYPSSNYFHHPYQNVNAQNITPQFLTTENIKLFGNQLNTFGQIWHELQVPAGNEVHEMRNDDVYNSHQFTENTHLMSNLQLEPTVELQPKMSETTLYSLDVLQSQQWHGENFGSSVRSNQINDFRLEPTFLPHNICETSFQSSTEYVQWPGGNVHPYNCSEPVLPNDSESNPESEFSSEMSGTPAESPDNLQWQKEDTHSSLRSDGAQINDSRSEGTIDNSNIRAASLETPLNNLKRAFLCEKCGNAYRSAASLKRHNKNVQKCNEPKSGLKFHRNSAHPDRQRAPNTIWRCDQCTKTFKMRCHFTQHKNVQHNANKVRCEICSKTFINPERRDTHMSNHFAPKPFACGTENCNRAFQRICDLRRHIKEHTQSHHKCSICEKGFVRLDHLESHERTHLKRRIFRSTSSVRKAWTIL